jgi:EamA domain-containing membrane protein RarD
MQSARCRDFARDRMTLPGATLLAQSALSGVFIGSLYGLLGLGLSLSWGLLHIINLAHFGFAFLAAYLCYQLASSGVMDPLATLGFLQYFSPTGQFLLGRFVYHEPFDLTKLICFSIVWLSLVIFSIDSVMAYRRHRTNVLAIVAPE